MESTRQQQEGLYQDHIPHGLFTSLERLRVDSPVTLDQLVRFFDAFDDIWDDYQHRTTSETTASGGEDAWARILSTSSPSVFDSRKQHALSTLEPRLVDCDETLMNSLGEPGSDEEKPWPSHGELVPVSIISFEELCGLWERVLSRLSTPQLGWRMNSESYVDAIRVLTGLRDRWRQLLEDDPSSVGEEDVVKNLPLTTSMSKVLRLLDQMRVKDFAREDIHTLPQPPPQDMDLNLELHPPARLALDLGLHLDLNRGLGRQVDEVQNPAAIPLPETPAFEEVHSDDSLYDPNEWFVSPEEVPVPRDVIMVNSPKIRHRILPSTNASKGQGETVSSLYPPGNLVHESTPSTHYSSPVEPPTPMITILPSGKMSTEGLMPNWLETLREQQEQGQRHLQQQIENLQQQLESVQLQYDQQHKHLTTLEQKQEPQRQEQMQLSNQLQDWGQQNKQAEWDRQEQMEDMQEQLLWQQQQLSNWEDLRQEGVWVQQSDFERLELQFERLHQLQKQQLQDDVGVKQSDFERLELQLERLQRQQKQQQSAPAPTSPPPNGANVQQQKSSQSSDQKKFQQLVADHHQLETKYRHLKQEFDRQAEKQRRQWERQQQIEHQLTKHQGIIQGHKQRMRQLNSDQKSQSVQYLRRIEELEEQLALLQESHGSLAVSSKASAEEPIQISLEETRSQEKPVEDPVPPQLLSNKQSTTTPPLQRPLSRVRTRRMTRTTSSLQDYSTPDAGSANRGPGPSDAGPAVKEVTDEKQSDSNEDSEPAEPREESVDNNSKVDEESARGSDSETEAKDETDTQSTITKETRSVSRSRRHNGGGDSEVPEVSVVADPINDYGVRRRSTVKRAYTKQTAVVRNPPRFRREQRRYRVTTSKTAISGEKKLEAAVESEEESEREREEETEKDSEKDSEKESENESDRHENSSHEEEKEEEEEEERLVPERTPILNTKVLRSQQRNNATITAASTVTMHSRRAMKEVKVEHKQEEKTTAPAPAARLPLLPRITRGSQINNSANIHTNTNNTGTNKIDNTAVIHISTSDVDDRAKENPRKRNASGSHEAIAKRRLRSLRSAGYIEATTRTRSSGPVRTYGEMLGPSAPKDLRIR
ncbi:hypothetical protein BGZ96_006804 [Linnemannia gamsii]|uniref:Uncharacterized protein n=1 Tax=Linnemannia gamsii TaxID=64522 RepID=A0ABQ7K1N1_9FUNG|nr:hypothetical protein BGZ96_006804 [Linnemannia gamsii]